MSDNDIYYIERILDRRNVNGRLEYKIKWEGYPMSQSTWEPLENLKTAIELVEEYDKLHPLPPPDLIGKKTNRPKKERVKKITKAVKGTPIPEKKEEIEQPKEEEKPENVINLDENQQNNNIIIEEDTSRKYNIDDSLKKVTTVRKKDNKLMAVVLKMKENGFTEEIELETNTLKYDNPWILLDFYESKIKFT